MLNRTGMIILNVFFSKVSGRELKSETNSNSLIKLFQYIYHN